MTARKPTRGGAPSMWGRAEEQAGNGARHLFARLGAPADESTAGIAALERIVARLRAGEWTPALAALVAQTHLLERTARTHTVTTVAQANVEVELSDAE